MQKSFFAIALALTLTSAFAAYSATNYVTPPVVVAQDSDTNFTNQSSLSLASITSGGVYLVSGNLTLNTGNLSANNWTLFYRQLNNQTLTATQNNTASILAPEVVSYVNNYAIGFVVDNSTNTTNLYAYQIPLINGTAAPPRLQLSNNVNANFNVSYLSNAQIGNTVYVAYLAANLTANITSFTVGTSTLGTPFNLSSNFTNPNSLSLAWGQSLGSSQLLAVWVENGVLKDAVINVGTGTFATPTTILNFNNNIQSCAAVATDGIFYGEFCSGLDPNNDAYTIYWVRNTANSSNLTQFANYTTNTSTLYVFFPYGPYLAVFFKDTTPATGTNYAYELWNLNSSNTTSVQNRTKYLNIDSNSTQSLLKVASGGVYTLLYNNRNGSNDTLHSVQVGLVLANISANGSNGSSNNTKGSSYLASVLGFLLTTVAGLLLF